MRPERSALRFPGRYANYGRRRRWEAFSVKAWIRKHEDSMTEGFQGGTPGNGHDGDRPLERLIHPGSGRRKAPKTPKGRQVEPETLAELHALLGDRPRNRDLLIEFLHLLQDRYGHLSARHMAALAQEMKLAMAEVYEVASFYAHFDIVTEHETPPPPLTVRVCDSLSCEMQGAQALLAALPGVLGSQVRVLRAPCVGRLRTCAGGRGRPSPH
jgi:NADH:ubiquinone oxidoreductase 24 kD subunit